MNVRSSVVAALVIGMLAAGAAAQAPKPEVTLKVGDPAPPLHVEKFIKGDAVKELEKGKVYVMEFWATWCGPCIAAFPHVTELQKKYADQNVVVIGVDIWERDRSGVEKFVQEQGDKMGYRVAMEAVEPGAGPNDGKMSRAWMHAAGRNGIPCSFIVDRELKVAWIGHPMMMDGPLEKIVAGKFDAQAEAAAEAARTAKQQEFSAAMRAKDFDKALSIIDGMIASDAGSAKMYRLTKLQVLAQKGDAAAANALAKEIAGAAGDDRGTLLSVVQVMSMAPKSAGLDQDLMLSLAKRVAEKAQDTDWQARMWLARVHAARGEFEQAAAVQRRVVETADPRAKAAMERALAEYEEKAAGPGAGGGAKKPL